MTKKKKKKKEREEKDKCTHMLIAALFTIAKTWKQPNQKMGRKNKIMPFAATWIELETLILNALI